MKSMSLDDVLFSYNQMPDEERLERVRQLLEEDPQRANQPNSSDQTPLLYAVFGGWFEIVRLLLDYHADPNIYFPKVSQTPLTAAIYSHHDTVLRHTLMELLLTHGANPNMAGSGGTTALFTALLRWHGEEGIKTVKFLLEYGARVDVRDRQGRMPLHWNLIHPEAVSLLLAQGADINARDAEDRTPLHTVAWEGLEEVVKTLVERGAEVNALDKLGRTPLFYALDKYLDTAKRLLEAGADPNVADKEGNTPLHQAATAHLPEGVEMLLEAGAQVNARNTKGQTPLKVVLKEKYGGEDHEYVIYTEKKEKKATQQKIAEILRKAGGVE
jgi:ankyrin repeat protein